MLQNRTVGLFFFLFVFFSAPLLAVMNINDSVLLDKWPSDFDSLSAINPSAILKVNDKEGSGVLSVNSIGEHGFLIWVKGKGLTFSRWINLPKNVQGAFFFQWPGSKEFLSVSEVKEFSEINSYLEYLQCRKYLASQKKQWCKDKEDSQIELLNAIRAKGDSKLYDSGYIATLKQRVVTYGEFEKEYTDELSVFDKAQRYKRFPFLRKNKPEGNRDKSHKRGPVLDMAAAEIGSESTKIVSHDLRSSPHAQLQPIAKGFDATPVIHPRKETNKLSEGKADRELFMIREDSIKESSSVLTQNSSGMPPVKIAGEKKHKHKHKHKGCILKSGVKKTALVQKELTTDTGDFEEVVASTLGNQGEKKVTFLLSAEDKADEHLSLWSHNINTPSLKEVESSSVAANFLERKNSSSVMDQREERGPSAHSVTQINKDMLSQWLQFNRQYCASGSPCEPVAGLSHQVTMGDLLSQPKLQAMSVGQLREYLDQHASMAIVEIHQDKVVAVKQLITPYKELAEALQPGSYLRKQFDIVEAWLRSKMPERVITIERLVSGLQYFNSTCALKERFIVPDWFREMTVITGLDATLWANVNESDNSCSVHYFDAHGQGPFNELKALRKAKILAEDVNIIFSAPAFFRNKTVQILFRHFYSLDNGQTDILDDLSFFGCLKGNSTADVLKAFTQGFWCSAQGEDLVLEKLSDDKLRDIFLQLPEIKESNLNQYARGRVIKKLAAWRQELAEAISALQETYQSQEVTAITVSANKVLGLDEGDGVDNSVSWRMPAAYLEPNAELLKNNAPLFLAKPLFGASKEAIQAFVQSARDILKPSSAL